MFFFVSFFLNHLLSKTGRGNEATEAVFAIGNLRELYDADFHKPRIYGSGRVWANAWDVSRRAPCRGGRGRLPAVDIVLCFRRGGFFIFFVFSDFFLRTHTAYSKYEATLPHLHLC